MSSMEAEMSWFGSREIQVTIRAAESDAEHSLDPIVILLMSNHARATAFATGQLYRLTQSLINSIFDHDTVNHDVNRMLAGR